MIDSVKPPLVIFVAMPASDMGLHATWVDTVAIKHHLYDPVAEQVAAALGTEVDLRIEKDKISQGAIHRSMFNEALQAPVYIADLTGANANVYLELGVRWALRDHVTVLVCQNIDQDVKFNVAVNRVIRYGQDPAELESARKKIVDAILEGLGRRHVDSPVRQSFDVNELHSKIARLRQERTVRHALGGRLLRSLGVHIRTPVDRQETSRRRVIAISAIACLLVFMAGIFAGEFFGAPYDGAGNPPDVLSAQPHEIGDAYPSQGEFLAKFVNQATGRCIARNGVQSDPNKYESPDPNNQASNIYQANCSTDRGDLSHTLVLDPIKDGWLIRSSVKINLCLQAKGSPSDDQHFAVCSQGDDRQQWIIQRIRHAAPEVVVIKNRDTGMCFAHPPPPADDSDIKIFQYQCVPDARTEWLIEKSPPIGAKDCRDQGGVRIRNRETGSYVGYGDQNRPRMGDESPTMSLATARQSAHGCTIQIVGPLVNCMGVLESPPAVEVLWMPCNGQPNQRWVIESLVKQNGEEWLQFRPSHDMSRCLQQSEENVKGALLAVLLCNEVRRQQWVMN